MYVGAEVSIGSFLVNFLGEAHIVGMPEEQAAHYIAYYWGGAMVGRFIGSAVMQKIPAGTVLAFNAFMAALLVLVAMTTSGSVAMWAILGGGFIQLHYVPNHFQLSTARLRPTYLARQRHSLFSHCGWGDCAITARCVGG